MGAESRLVIYDYKNKKNSLVKKPTSFFFVIYLAGNLYLPYLLGAIPYLFLKHL